MNLPSILIIALGGAIGSVLRYLLSVRVSNATLNSTIPYGILAVNVLGGLLMGMLVAYLMRGEGEMPLATSTFLLLGTGVLGGFTTFSSFALESFFLLEKSAYMPAIIYILLSVLGSVGALFAGYYITKGYFHA